MKIAIAQINPTIGDFAGNVARILDIATIYRHADLVVFPELSVCGYYPQDLVEEPGFIERQNAALEEIVANTVGMEVAVVVGAVTRNTGPGKPFHNSLLVIRDGKVILTYHKQLLPTY